MPIVVAVVLALLLGAGLSTQAGINTSLRNALGHPLHATILNFVIGIATVFLLAFAVGLRTPPRQAFSATSGWMYLGGVIGALYVYGIVVLAPRLGAATLFALVVTGQLVAAVLIDHFGWLGFAPHAVNPTRLMGAALLVAGVVLVRR